MGVRRQGRSLGAAAPLQQQEDQAQEAQAVGGRRRGANGQILANIRIVNGERERLCSGPSHHEPTWLPDTDKFFYTRKSGKYAGYRVSRCRLCSANRAGLDLDESGYVPAFKIKPFLIEGRNRVGTMEFCRRAKIGQKTMYDILHNNQRRVTRAVAKRIMLEVVSIRRKNEVRHRDSIFAGSTVRGWKEKPVTSPDDLYEPKSPEELQELKDADAKRQRDKRAGETPEQRADRLRRDAERKKRKRQAKTAV